MVHSIQLPRVYESFVVEPYTPNIGATLHGLDLSQPLSEVAQTELKAALARYEVIFFRDQVLTPAQQVTFTRSFGKSTKSKPSFPEWRASPRLKLWKAPPSARRPTTTGIPTSPGRPIHR